MAEVTLTATTGRPTGSSASRRLRAEGKIPATVYGMGSEALSVTVTRADLRRAMTTEAGVNALIRLEIEGHGAEYALVKEIQRHQVRREVTHLDLLRIDPEKAMVLDVPIVLEGDAKRVTSGGGFIDQKLSNLRVVVRPDSIPTQLTLNIAGMEVEELRPVLGVLDEIEPFFGDLENPEAVARGVGGCDVFVEGGGGQRCRHSHEENSGRRRLIPVAGRPLPLTSVTT